jgi:hypothetical protein
MGPWAWLEWLDKLFKLLDDLDFDWDWDWDIDWDWDFPKWFF